VELFLGTNYFIVHELWLVKKVEVWRSATELPCFTPAT
jgi:hypothetical protein